VVLLRHGETDFHTENRYAGITDLPLNDTGRRQAAELGRWAASTRICALLSSDLRRAIETAEPIARAAGISPVVEPRFRELDFGRGEGLTRDEMRERFPAEREAFEIDPFANSLPAAESASDAVVRARAALRDAVKQASDADADELVVIVCHSTLLRLLATDLIGALRPNYRTLFPSIRPASGIVLETDGERAGILAVNPDLQPGWRA
jgi:probable phosphoglycerate mutase